LVLNQLQEKIIAIYYQIYVLKFILDLCGKYNFNIQTCYHAMMQSIEVKKRRKLSS
jgi:hypothetical protein